MHDRSRLRGLIYQNFRNQKEFAEAVGWPKSRVSKILNGSLKIKWEDIDKLASTLDVPLDQIGPIFFSRK